MLSIETICNHYQIIILNILFNINLKYAFVENINTEVRFEQKPVAGM